MKRRLTCHAETDSISKKVGKWCSLTAPALLLVLASDAAHAHIKWFVEFDIADPPRPLAEVINPYFLALLAMASVALFLTYTVDAFWTRMGRFAILDRTFGWRPDLSTSVVRLGMGIFFVSLWLMGGVILTPETTTNAGFVQYIHFFTAFFLLFRRTLVISALGIISLYIYGTTIYGVFHMTEYALFLGFAVFLALASFDDENLKRRGTKILYFTLVFAFLWSSIEKFAYAEWFHPFLDANEFLTMGMDYDLFLLCAAFVEFTLVFVLFTGNNIVVVGAVVLNGLIIAAALYFGKVDAIGHFPVMVTLVLLAIKGAEKFPVVPSGEGGRVLVRSTYLILAYWTTLVLFIAMYYGLHAAFYG